MGYLRSSNDWSKSTIESKFTTDDMIMAEGVD